jgi:preprotein translocase subunit SecG
MEKILPILQIVISVLLVVVILLQQKGTGLSVTFGGFGGGEHYRSRRGIEKFLFAATIVLAVLMVAVSLANAFVS